MDYGFAWPLGLSARHISQLLFAKRAGSLTEVLPQVLEQTYTEWTLGEVYDWLDKFETACQARGVYVLDHNAHPEEWHPPAIPRVVRDSMYFSDPDLRNTPRLLQRYQGYELPTGLSEEERSEALLALRQTIVYFQICKETNCHNEIMITLNQVGRSIEKFGLTADNPYQPSTRCKVCRKKHVALGVYVDKINEQKKEKKEKSLVTLGDIFLSKQEARA
jgi:hypothetical protein